MEIFIRGGNIVDARGIRPNPGLKLSNGLISYQDNNLQDGFKVIDASDFYIFPGFIDVHTHGGGGFDLHTTDSQEIISYCKWAPSTGVTSFLIGVVGIPHGIPIAQIQAAVNAIESHQEGAEPLGIHLEGPYISPEKRGAHDTSWLRTPDIDETNSILQASKGHLRLVTIAPELPNARNMISLLIDNGVRVSIGHTNSTYEQALEAIGWGITHATHCFNAMPPLHHREPGTLGAIAESPQVMGEVIADGVHVHPAVVKILVKALGSDRTIVITDALSAAGCPSMEFTFGGQKARVIDGAARLEDGRLTGSVLTMDQALRNMVEKVEVELPDAVRMLTLNPAISASAESRKGLIESGYDADLVLMNQNLQLVATICKGKIAYAIEGFSTKEIT